MVKSNLASSFYASVLLLIITHFTVPDKLLLTVYKRLQIKDKLLLYNIVKFIVEPLAEPQALAQAQRYDAIYHQKGDRSIKKLMSICLTVNT